MWNAFKGTGYTLDVDISRVLEANSVFRECMSGYYFPPEALRVSSEVLLSPMPGGALTANTMMMRDTGTLDLYPRVIEAMGECVAKGGFGTSVTPVSQFYFQQAYANVTQGPWEKITDGYGNMVLGYFGRTPVEPDPEIVAVAEKQMEKPRFEGDPLDILEPGIPEARATLEKESLEVTDENIFIVGALETPGGNKGLEFLKGNFSVNVRMNEEKQRPAGRGPAASTASRVSATGESFVITVDGKSHNVTVKEGTSEVLSVTEAPREPAPAPAPSGDVVAVSASVPGNVYRLVAGVGDKVRENETLILIEAMKMETPVASPCDGEVASIEVAQGDVVEAGQLILTILPS